MNTYLLRTGFFKSDGGAMFGLLPKSIWSRYYTSDAKNQCVMAMNTLLIRKEDRIILFDTGIGTKMDRKLGGYGFFNLKDPLCFLEEEGISREQVTDIVLSHLHFDHCGGITYINKEGELCETYPNATYHVSKRQWNHSFKNGLLDGDAYFPENTRLLLNNPRLHLITDEELELTPWLTLKQYDGHTPGQLVSRIQTPEGILFFAGDVVPLQQNMRIEAISAYDLRAETSANEKVRLLDEIAGQNGYILFYHDAPYPGTFIQKNGNGRFTPRKQCGYFPGLTVK